MFCVFSIRRIPSPSVKYGAQPKISSIFVIVNECNSPKLNYEIICYSLGTKICNVNEGPGLMEGNFKLSLLLSCIVATSWDIVKI